MKKCKYCCSEIDDKAKICPHCGKRQPVKSVAATVFAIVLICVVVVFVVAILLPTDESAGFTDERRAQIGKLFEDGNYKLAIDSCNDIKTQAPDDAEEVNSFIDEQIAKYVHISANELMSAYEANEVNADKTYGVAPIVVTGKVYDVGKMKTLLGSEEISVLLYTNYSFRGVQLSFLSTEEDAIAAIEKGQQLTVLGKCRGEDGVIGNNVYLIDCIILNDK